MNISILKNASWSLIGSVVPKFAIFITSVFLGRILGIEAFGELSVVRSTINMFTAFATAGLAITATKYISEYIEDNVKIGEYISLSNFTALFLGLVLGSIVFLFSEEIASNIIKIPNLKFEIQIGALMLFANAMNASQIGILSGFQNYKVIAINSILAIFLALPIQLFGAFYFGVKGAIIGFSFNFILLYFFNEVSIRKILKNRSLKVAFFAFKNVWKTLISYTLPSSLSGLMVTPVLWLVTVILVRGNNGVIEMGLYEAANQIKMVVVFIPIALSQVILPVLVEKKNDELAYSKFVNKNILLNGFISFVIFLFVYIFSPYIIGLFGEEFKTNHTVLNVLSASTIFMAINNIIGQILASKDKMWVGFMFNLAWAATLISCTIFLVNFRNLGAVGVAYSFLIAYGAHTLWQFVYYKFRI